MAAKVAHGSEARLNSGARVRRGNDGLLRDVEVDLSQPKQIVIAGKIKCQMRVRIHETWRKRRVAEVDYLCVIGNRQVASRIDNFVAEYDNDGVLRERVRFTVEHPCGFERERFLECKDGALVLIEQSQVTSAINEHAGIGGQHLQVNHVVFLESDRPISQTASLEVRVWRVVKTLVAREAKNEAFWNKLIGLRNPLC